MNDFYRLRCPHCKRYYKNRDHVALDLINTVLHVKCHNLDNYVIKDLGLIVK